MKDTYNTKELSFQAVKVSANQICYEGGATSLVEVQQHLQKRGYRIANQNEVKAHMDQLVKVASDWNVEYAGEFPVYHRAF